MGCSFVHAFALRFWEMTKVDGVIGLEVFKMTRPSEGDAVEDGVGTPIALVRRGAWMRRFQLMPLMMFFHHSEVCNGQGRENLMVIQSVMCAPD